MTIIAAIIPSARIPSITDYSELQDMMAIDDYALYTMMIGDYEEVP
jgi:hypothetical protein